VHPLSGGSFRIRFGAWLCTASPILERFWPERMKRVRTETVLAWRRGWEDAGGVLGGRQDDAHAMLLLKSVIALDDDN